MQKRNRMIWTLAVLAVSMTGAAGFLHNFDPYSGIDGAASPEQLRLLARSLVRDDVALDPGRWHSIEVLRRPMDVTGVQLSASADPTESHFYVDARGRLSRSTRWRKQSATSSAPDSIRVQIASENGRPMSAPQWYAVQALIDVIHETMRNRDHQLPVQTHDEYRDVQFFAPSISPKGTKQLHTSTG